MSKIVGIGACVCDTLITVPNYPKEDTKLRAKSTVAAGGGPVSTGLVAASKLGISTGYIGVFSDDSGGEFLKRDFLKYGVDIKNTVTYSGYRSFTSTIWLSEETTSRTCVFDKGNLPPLTFDENGEKAVADALLLMVDGNEMDAAIKAAQFAKKCGVKVLYDCGGLYDGAENLLKYTDYIIPSEEFALAHTGCSTPDDAAKKLYETYSPEFVVITQGKNGGLIFDGKKITRYPIYPANVVDSNGSGDVFHGAFAAGICKGYAPEKCCHFASAVSALKCTKVGAREGVPDFETVKKYLRENGYEL